MSNHPSRRTRSGRRPARGRQRALAGTLADLDSFGSVPSGQDGDTIVVNHLEWRGDDPWDLRGEHALAIALDQRVFGPRMLIVASAERDGTVVRINYTGMTDPPELGLTACLDAPGLDAVAAVAYSDEPVAEGPPPPELAERFLTARAVAAVNRIHLVDWWLCDDTNFRSMKWSAAAGDDPDWWDVP
jgi:hypothetical protein